MHSFNSAFGGAVCRGFLARLEGAFVLQKPVEHSMAGQLHLQSQNGIFLKNWWTAYRLSNVRSYTFRNLHDVTEKLWGREEGIGPLSDIYFCAFLP